MWSSNLAEFEFLNVSENGSNGTLVQDRRSSQRSTGRPIAVARLELDPVAHKKQKAPIITEARCRPGIPSPLSIISARRANKSSLLSRTTVGITGYRG